MPGLPVILSAMKQSEECMTIKYHLSNGTYFMGYDVATFAEAESVNAKSFHGKAIIEVIRSEQNEESN